MKKMASDVKKRTSFILRFANMPRTKEHFQLTNGRLLMPNGTWGGRRKSLKICSIFHCVSFATIGSSNVGISIFEIVV
jgi:hypothetical protein